LFPARGAPGIHDVVGFKVLLQGSQKNQLFFTQTPPFFLRFRIIGTLPPPFSGLLKRETSLSRNAGDHVAVFKNGDYRGFCEEKSLKEFIFR
jgi:hypothetical protein